MQKSFGTARKEKQKQCIFFLAEGGLSLCPYSADLPWLLASLCADRAGEPVAFCVPLLPPY